MKFPMYTIAIAAVMMAALAGVVVFSDDAYADDGYTVTFDGVNADTIVVDDVTYFIVPADPEKEGKTFAGWVDADGEDLVEETLYYVEVGSLYTEEESTYEGVKSVTVVKDVSSDIAFTSTFTPYDVKWIVNGVTIATGTYEDSFDTINMPSDPYMDGYSFVGWAVNGEIVTTVTAGEIVLPDDYKFIGDTEFVAVFQANQLTVTLVVDGSTISQIASFGEIYVMPALPEGYSYWTKSVTEDEEGNVTYGEAFDFSVALTKDVTLYAVPSEEVVDDTVYVTFVIDASTYGPYAITDRFSIPATDKDGYEFTGWIIVGGDGTKMSNAEVQEYIQSCAEDVIFLATYDTVIVVEPEPAFYETTIGQVVIVLAVFIILMFGYAVYSNMFGLRDKLSRTNKEDKE